MAESLPALASVGILVAVAWYVGRDLWFFSDDWNIFAGYHSGNLLEPFNGHLSLVPAGTYQALFHASGVESYMPYRVAGLAAYAVLGYQVCRYGARRSWVVALVATTALVWNSSGETNVLFPFLLNFSVPLAALVACWRLLDRIGTDGPAARVVAFGLWLALALATSGLGLVVAGALAVELLARRSAPRLWAAWAAPVASWALWWATHRGDTGISLDPVVVVPYALRMLLAGASALGAGMVPLGAVLLVVLLVGIAWHVRCNGGPSPRMLGATGAAAAFCILTAMTRQDTVVPVPPDELRYGWTVGALLVLTALAVPVEASSPGEDRSRGARRPGVPPALPAAAAVAAGVLLVAGAWVLFQGMRDWSEAVLDAAPGLRSNIYAAEALGERRVPPDAVLGPLSYVPVDAREYLDGVADVGSPLAGAPLRAIGGRPEQRAEADRFFFEHLDLADPVPVSEGPDGDAGEVRAVDDARCAAELQAEPGTELVVMAADPTGADAARAPDGAAIELAISRFDRVPRVVLDIADAPAVIRLPNDAEVGTPAVVPYRVSAGSGAVVCPAR